MIQDSHREIPLCRKLSTYEELLADKDLVPFEEFAKDEFPRALMMAHLALPNIDPTGRALDLFQKSLIQDNLRGKN